MYLIHFFTYCVLYTHQLLPLKIAEITAKNMLKQQAGLLHKSFISVIKKKHLSVCYIWSVGSYMPYS